MTARRPYVEVFLFSLAAILLEVGYTRVFSYKLVYYFTYLIIGIALLGLGAGGVLVTLVPRLRRMGHARLVAVCGFVAGASVLGGYHVVATTPFNAFQLVNELLPFYPPVVLREGTHLVSICACLFTPFFAAGVALAAIFSVHADRFNRLYAADLVGAALGCAAIVPLMASISPPGCVQLAGACFALAGVRAAVAGNRPLLVLTLPLTAILLTTTVRPSLLPDVVPDREKSAGRSGRPLRALFSGWSPVFRVDVVPSPTNAERVLLLIHDGMLGSTIQRYDGDPASLSRFDDDERALPFALLGPQPRVAIIGAAGGHEILASMHFGASAISAVELNPVTVSLLTTRFADYSGNIAHDPRVTLVNGEGRWFLRQDPTRYDLIWLVAPDSYAAMNAATSGAFVLSESYLYTAEMLVDGVAHLSPGGVICVQFGEVDFDRKPNRTARYLATAREAFHRLGIDDFERHVLVTTREGLFTLSTIVLRPTPFTAEEVARYAAHARAMTATTVRQVPGANDGGPIGAVVTLPSEELRRWYARQPFDLTPVTDDAPFFWHFVRFSDAIGPIGPYRDREEGTGERMLLVLLLAATAFAALALLTPLVLVRATWRTIPHKLRAGFFFAAIGTGFMLLEVSLIQRLTLFLGYPTRSLTVTLFALLIFTGLGSLLSERLTTDAARTYGRSLGLALVALVAFYRWGVPPLVDRLIGLPFPLRAALAIAWLAPLGTCLGVFMPLGLRTIVTLTSRREEFVAWAWAVNGFFSVVSSVLATIVSMMLGLNAVMLIALALYLTAILALRGLTARVEARTVAPGAT